MLLHFHRKPVLFSISLALMFLGGSQAHALPEFLMRFSQDPFARPEFRGQCSTCHISPQGGGPRNPFGTAFEQNDKMITPELRAAWPDRFLPSVAAAPLPSQSGQVKATFLANERDTILEIGGEYFLLNSREAKLERLEQQQVAQLTAAPASTTAAATTGEPKLPLRAQPTFDHYLVNLPTTLPYTRGRISLRFTHRFTQPVLRSGNDCPDCGGIAELFGFDSFSYSSFGVEVGLTRRLAFTFYRSPLLKDYEFGGVMQLLNQQGASPVSAALRVSLETRSLFSFQSSDFERFQSGSVILPVSHAVSDVAEVFVAPMMSWNVNPNANAQPLSASPGERRKNLAVIGVGTSIRFRPRSAFVAEFLPRVAGYHPDDSRHAISFGLQRTTNGHVFELTLSNTIGTTTNGAFIGGGRDFALGFNLYRRIR